jgi:ABC-type phosphate transport system auxiliary subunit
VTLSLPLSSPASPFFRIRGQRRSKLYPSSSLGLLALALPRELSQRTCRVLYALGEDGIGIVAFKRLLHEEDLSQREALPPQHLLLLIQDSYGHLFGAFLSLQKHQTDLLAPQLSFLFRALPDLRTFPLLQRCVPLPPPPLLSV